MNFLLPTNRWDHFIMQTADSQPFDDILHPKPAGAFRICLGEWGEARFCAFFPLAAAGPRLLFPFLPFQFSSKSIKKSQL